MVRTWMAGYQANSGRAVETPPLAIESGQGWSLGYFQYSWSFLQFPRAHGRYHSGFSGRAPLRAGIRRISENEGVSDFDKVAQQLEAFDFSVAQRFASLSNRQKRWLINNTNFSVVVREATWYNDKAHKWETKSDAGDVETRLDEWMTSAARH